MDHDSVTTAAGPRKITLVKQVPPRELRVAGVECTYSGELSEAYTGTMSCPDREAVPLRLWLK